MKRTLSLVLCAVMLLSTLLFTSCVEHTPKTELDLLIESFANTASAFSTNRPDMKLPDLSAGSSINIKADIPALAGFSIDADILEVHGDDPFAALKLNKFNLDTVKLNDISAYFDTEKIAASIGDVSTDFVGFPFSEIEDVLEQIFGDELDEATKAEISAFFESITELQNQTNSSAEPDLSLPKFTDAHTAVLYALLKEKAGLAMTEDEGVTTVTYSLTLSALSEITEAMEDELRNDKVWDDFFETFEKAFVESYNTNTEVTPIESIDDLIEQLEEILSESDYDFSELTLNGKYTIEKIKSRNMNCITSEAFEIKYKDSVEADGNVTYDLDGKAVCNAAINMYKSSYNEFSSDVKIEAVIENKNVSEEESNFSSKFNITVDEESVELAFESSSNSSDGSFEIAVSVKAGETDETVSIEGSLNSTDESLIFTLDAIRIKSVGIGILPQLSVTVKPIGNDVSFPEYTDIRELTDNDLLDYIKYFTEFFGVTSEPEIII